MPNFFYTLRQPRGLHRYFGLDVTVEKLREAAKRAGKMLPTIPSHPRHIVLTVLVMGWDWAPFVAHSCLNSLLEKAWGLAFRSSTMIYGLPVPELGLLTFVMFSYIDTIFRAESI